MRTKKIPVKRIRSEVKTHNGLFGEGCIGSRCNDECCQWGCDVDLETLNLILRHRGIIEPLIGRMVEECFGTGLIHDDDYIGNAYRETVVRGEDGRCAFHLIGKRGCSLFYAWATRGVSKKIVPTICRIYPVTWHKGDLYVDSPLVDACKCLEKTDGATKIPSLYETQGQEIAELFEFEE